MILIDEYRQKFKAVKKDGKYYLLTCHTDNFKGEYRKVEVEGKENIYKYIKNNKLRKYEEIEDE
jgi:hypothetical protein